MRPVGADEVEDRLSGGGKSRAGPAENGSCDDNQGGKKTPATAARRIHFASLIAPSSSASRPSLSHFTLGSENRGALPGLSLSSYGRRPTTLSPARVFGNVTRAVGAAIPGAGDRQAPGPSRLRRSEVGHPPGVQPRARAKRRTNGTRGERRDLRPATQGGWRPHLPPASPRQTSSIRKPSRRPSRVHPQARRHVSTPRRRRGEMLRVGRVPASHRRRLNAYDSVSSSSDWPRERAPISRTERHRKGTSHAVGYQDSALPSCRAEHTKGPGDRAVGCASVRECHPTNSRGCASARQ